ncbi:MAG: 30S ribosomal protein S3 [Candidatus Magasanikbacteria bacterium]|nr:30S ribosomal protein S3 [Candidatus Magasanikbacteria bacterium]MCA9391040.1 30S ribosomal protein S3 [Candidatus Magasanikbacteria bacterium]USN52596.1 MAG: 30S ribosomal protein S3 [Candidatus Nomurabacteria bacterium]
MGHKVNPKVFRLGMTTTWPSRWFARNDVYRQSLQQDLGIREYLEKELKDAGVNRIEIERSRGVVTITVHAARPGIAIGRGGEGSDALKKKIEKKFFPGQIKTLRVNLNIQEVANPGIEAALVVQSVISDLERRMAFRRVLKMTIERVKKSGALGVKIAVSGRLNGAEIARREWLAWGKIPLTNLRADIDYSANFAMTKAGAIGVKVWIYRGDIFNGERPAIYQPTTPRRRDDRGPRRDGMGGGRPPRRDSRGGGTGRPVSFGSGASKSAAPSAPAAPADSQSEKAS